MSGLFEFEDISLSRDRFIGEVDDDARNRDIVTKFVRTNLYMLTYGIC